MMGGTALGMNMLVYYLFVYLFSNLAAFGVVISIENKPELNISDYNGLYSTNPKLSIVMMLAMFSEVSHRSPTSSASFSSSRLQWNKGSTCWCLSLPSTP